MSFSGNTQEVKISKQVLTQLLEDNFRKDTALIYAEEVMQAQDKMIISLQNVTTIQNKQITNLKLQNYNLQETVENKEKQLHQEQIYKYLLKTEIDQQKVANLQLNKLVRKLRVLLYTTVPIAITGTYLLLK